MILDFRFLIWAVGLLVCATGEAQTGGWRMAEPGWSYQFPRDHGVHRDFKTEWWYFTGELKEEDGREFGYELTWFREGVMPMRPAGASRFVVQDFKFAHFAVSDLAGGRFYFAQKVARGAYGEAGNGDGNPGPLAWIDDWRLTIESGGAWHIEAEDDGRKLELDLTPVKGPVIEGEDGVSHKAAGGGHASCYYSYTRMRSEGRLSMPGSAPAAVVGETWFDHEWASNQLAPDEVGWDWFSVQLSGGTELMLYRMRLKDGRADSASSGTYTGKDGRVVYLKAGDFKLTPLEYWKSGMTGGNYPIRWAVEIPRLNLSLAITTPLKDQELALPWLAYWEGLIHAAGSAGGTPVTGHGYLELTGYGAALSAMGE